MAAVKIPFLITKRNRNGGVRHYWQPSQAARKAGFRTKRLSDNFDEAMREARRLNRLREPPPRRQKPDHSLLGSGIYLVSDGEMIKIGRSRTLPRRWNELQVGNGRPLKLIFFVALPDEACACRVEAAAHHALRFHRQHGEWFTVDAKIALRTLSRILENLSSELFADTPN